jgi:hypothetical protein
MQTLTGQFWKVAATSLALIPGLYGIIFFMVQAKTESLDVRLRYLEMEMAKGRRFTMKDGEGLHRQLEQLAIRHDRDRELIREADEKIRYEDASLKANQQNLIVRFARLEERIYAYDVERGKNGAKKAPYKLPHNFEDFRPAALDFNGLRDL